MPVSLWTCGITPESWWRTGHFPLCLVIWHRYIFSNTLNPTGIEIVRPFAHHWMILVLILPMNRLLIHGLRMRKMLRLIIMMILCLLRKTLIIGIVLLLRWHLICLVMCFSHTMVLLSRDRTTHWLHSLCSLNLKRLRFKILGSLLPWTVILLSKPARPMLIVLIFFNSGFFPHILRFVVRLIPAWGWGFSLIIVT